MSLEIFNSLLLAFSRSFGLLAMLPFSGGLSSVTLRGSISLMLALTYALESGSIESISIAGIISEFFIGAIIALPARLVIVAMETWGELLDSGRGQTIASIYNPMSESPGSQSSFLLSSFTWAVLVYYSFLPILIKSFYKSFDIIGLSKSSFGGLEQQAYGVLISIGILLQSAIIHYLPIAVMFFVFDVLVGFCSKALNNSHFYSENFQAKTYLSLILMICILGTDLPSLLLLAAEPRLEFLSINLD